MEDCELSAGRVELPLRAQAIKAMHMYQYTRGSKLRRLILKENCIALFVSISRDMLKPSINFVGRLTQHLTQFFSISAV